MREKCLHLLTLFSSFFFLVFFFALGKAANRTTQSDEKDDDAKKNLRLVVLSLFVERALSRFFRWTTLVLVSKRERERERERTTAPFIFPQRTSKALRER